MLVEQERTARPENAPRFLNDRFRVTHHAEHQSRNDRIKTASCERERFAGLAHNCGLPALPLHLPSQAPDHVGIRLDKSNLRLRRKERQVGASAAANFQNSALRHTGCALPIWDDTTFHPRVQKIVARRKQALVEAHCSDELT